jgi:hypothetical protein
LRPARSLAPLLSAVLLALATAAAGQLPPVDPPDSEEPARRSAEPRWSLGLRLGAFEMTNAPDSWDAVYGSPMPQLGGQVELRLWRHLMVALAADWGEASGHRILPTQPPIRTEFGTNLTYLPAHLTLGWVARADRPWELTFGLGPSLLTWRESSDGDSNSDSVVGGHVAFGARRNLARFALGAEVRWSTFADSAGDRGAMAFFDEDDMGGLALQLVALWRL